MNRRHLVYSMFAELSQKYIKYHKNYFFTKVRHFAIDLVRIQVFDFIQSLKLSKFTIKLHKHKITQMNVSHDDTTCFSLLLNCLDCCYKS